MTLTLTLEIENALAAQVYEGLSQKGTEEVERIVLDRSQFFGERQAA